MIPILAKVTLTKIKRPFQQRALKSDLSQLVAMAKDHEANGLPVGHAHYVRLFELATQKADAYAELKGISNEQVYAELACLEVLKKLAHPGVERAKTGGLVAVIGLLLIPIAIGIFSGMTSIGYHWVLRIFGVH